MKDKITDFQELEASSPFPSSAYEIDVHLGYLEEAVQRYGAEYGLDLNPDFQRAHVWTREQQAAFVVYLLQGGPSARVLYFACHGWSRSVPMSPMVIVDGKQRLEAVLSFLRDEYPIHGRVCSKWTGRLRMHRGFKINIADVDRERTLRWYLALNTGGTPHTDSEISRVKELLRKEAKK
jgi:hypothetical protein